MSLVGAACLLIALSMLHDPWADEPWVTDTAQRSVAIATLPCSTALQANSTGFVTGDRTVVTVAHAIFESRDVAVRDAFGRWHRPVVVRLDLERDIAVLRIDDLRATALDRVESRPVSDWPGTSVTMIDGAASGTLDASIRRRVRIRTEVVGDREQQFSRSGFEVAVDIAPGDSGAALVDLEGRLAGMVFARSKSREGITWATAVDELDPTPGEVATWPCDPLFDAELVLDEPDPPQLP